MKRINLMIWEKENGYKAKYVAKKLGISETTYSQIKNGKTTPSIDLLYRFTAIYGEDINVLELFRMEGEKNDRKIKKNTTKSKSTKKSNKQIWWI